MEICIKAHRKIWEFLKKWIAKDKIKAYNNLNKINLN